MSDLNFNQTGAMDLTVCATEPIHTPGLSQPHGALLAVTQDGVVSHASANLAALTGVDAAEAIGRPLAAILGRDAAGIAMAAPGVAAMHLQEVAFIGVLPGPHPARVMMSAHHYDGCTIIDLEPGLESGDGAAPPLNWIYQLQRQMMAGTESAHVADSLATAIHGVTGYDHVMVYAFDPDWHGHVIGEARAAGVGPSYLDLHFPASDIPAQARELYRRQLLRIVVDSHSPGVPVLSSDGRALDMSFAVLRSVSPLHLEYLRNMGVRASAVASILVGNQLWGMLVGHHRQGPRAPSLLDRKAFQMGAMLAGSALAAQTLARTLRLTGAINESIDRITAGAATMPLAKAMAGELPVLMQILSLDGITAEVAGGRVTAGAPTASIGVGDSPYSLLLTDRFPDAVLDEASDIVGGCLFGLSSEPTDRVMLGRVEHRREVKWGGDPRKAAQAATAPGARLRPRASFAQWKETVTGRCRGFSPEETAAIELLQRRLGMLVQAQAERMGRERASQTERLTAIGRIAGGVAHDLNNLLGVISLNLESARMSTLSHDADSLLQAALTAVESGSSVTSALLSFARRQHLRPVTINAVKFLTEFMTMVKPLMGRGFNLELKCDADIKMCRADPAQYQTALLNLVVNARDSMWNMGGLITLTAHNRHIDAPITGFGHTIPAGDYVAFSVSDQGHGMADDVLSQATEPFFTTKAPGEGTGLGLPMVFGFAAQSGGMLTLASAPGAGTTATILLPAFGPKIQTAAPSVLLGSASALSGKRLLVVEDRSDLSEVVATSCRMAGMAVTAVDTAATAATLLREEPFDLVLSDLMLGGLYSGLDVLTQAQSCMPPVPVLLMTGFAEADEMQAAELAKHRVLRKPFKIRDMMTALQEVVTLDDGRDPA